MSLWWLQPGWTDTCCAACGSRIYPEGDPDWGLCLPCFDAQMNQQREAERYEAEMRESDMPPAPPPPQEPGA